MTMSNAQSARISAAAAGASGRAQNARAAAFAAAETGSPSPAQAFRLGCEAVRVHGQVQPRRRVKDPAWVEAGRPAGAIAPERQEGRRGPERVADGEAEVAQRGCVGVEAQDFGGGRGALQRQAGAQRPGGGRIGAQIGVEKASPAPAANSGSPSPALPLPAPRPGSAPAAERLAVPGFSRGPLGSRAPAGRRRERGPEGLEAVVEQARVRRESPAA